MRRQLSLTDPQLRGEDIKEVQRKVGLRGDDVDGVYGGFTAAAVEEWKWKVGYPVTKITPILGLWGQAMLFGELEFPADFKDRAKSRVGKPYVPVKNGVARPISVPTPRWSEFRVPDAEGAPDRNGKRFHAAKDWSAPAGTVVRAPVDGTIIERKLATTHTGQVYGGTVKIQGADGKVWVMRHVEPGGVGVGGRVRRAQVVATVSPWRSGGPHTHFEIWKTLAGGYNLENMLDPMRFF